METIQETKKKPNLFMYLSLILLVVCAILSWQLIRSHKTITEQTDTIVQANQEKEQMILKLENLKKEYDQLSADNAQLSEMFDAEKAHVESLLTKIKNSEGTVSKYKKQVALMETRLKEYEQQIEELKKQNKDLIEENFHIKTILDSATIENKELNSENKELSETVSKGSALVTYDINIDGIVTRSTGKEIPTKKAKKAQKIRACFTIGENAIASAGNKTVYMRIADPAENILYVNESDEYSFEYQGKKLQYTAKEQITYNNKAVDLCIYWAKTKDFVPGTYVVDLFSDGNLIGTSQLTLEK
ncbi:MAG: hypothetical protein PHR81_07080 [Bacteroidales bacterium]|jgi:hypothetical protein|nr:hypothetical protein [Bacteroidales bacterium]MDD4214559.1 hypothetical protein [Bacteroidales bacterium]